jgi:hypothetical protein
MKNYVHTHLNVLMRILGIALIGLLSLSSATQAQEQFKWLNAGSLHSWYSNLGFEGEEAFVKRQQYGLQWPAIYRFQDTQAAKGLWLGARNFADDRGNNFPFKVVHKGPRASGLNAFFPVEFKLISRFEWPVVSVDGIDTFEKPIEVDQVDPTMAADLMIYNKVNTQLGITMERKIMQFSNSYHDNYHITEYIFTNTGNTDGDAEIELPNNTVTDFWAFMQWRYSVVAETRYVIGNATGWGINNMNDVRGDGVKPDPPGEQYRANFSWHGKFPAFTAYDNIGGPIWAPALNVLATDTVGRLGAIHFVGNVTLHADTSPTNKADDVSQPRTTRYVGSDDNVNSQNDPFNPAKMTQEYALMSSGHASPRHADVVEPSGNFLMPTGDPSLGTSGGYSSASGYGPYTLAPGQSVRIVVAEGVSGISRERAIEIGRRYKQGQIDALQKNTVVFQGKDSLFQTFKRATDNFKSGYKITRAPQPPSYFEVASGGTSIKLIWDYTANDAIEGFEIYRAQGDYYEPHTLIHTAPASAREFEDVTPIRGLDYYYYIVAVASTPANDGSTPSVKLRSNRYYTQTYDPANLKRPPGNLDTVVIVPNPYNIEANSDDRAGFDRNQVRFRGNQIQFINMPGRARIQIFTEIGQHIRTINHTDGTGSVAWNLLTESRQLVVSGIYLAVIEDTETGDRTTKKIVIIR